MYIKDLGRVKWNYSQQELNTRFKANSERKILLFHSNTCRKMEKTKR